MVNKAIFKTYLGKLLPGADTKNHEAAPAYQLTPREALAQYAVTGTFYADGAEQLLPFRSSRNFSPRWLFTPPKRVT